MFRTHVQIDGQENFYAHKISLSGPMTFVVTGALRSTCFSLQELELLKRDFKNLEKDCSSLKEQMDIKDRLLQVNF